MKMKYVGPVLTEDEMMCGKVEGNAHIFVSIGTYMGAPKSLCRAPEYWQRRWETGEFETIGDCPTVYVRKDNHTYPPHGFKYELPPVEPEQAHVACSQAQHLANRWIPDWEVRRHLWRAWQRRCEPSTNRDASLN